MDLTNQVEFLTLSEVLPSVQVLFKQFQNRLSQLSFFCLGDLSLCGPLQYKNLDG